MSDKKYDLETTANHAVHAYDYISILYKRIDIRRNMYCFCPRSLLSSYNFQACTSSMTLHDALFLAFPVLCFTTQV